MKQDKITKVKAWVTKYALTTGIREVEGEIDESLPTMLVVRKKPYSDEYFHGKMWWRTREEAVKHANAMRLKRIVKLNKELLRLESLIFD